MAHHDIQQLNRAFVDAQNEVRALYQNAVREKDARITIFAKCINVVMCADFGLGFFNAQMLNKERFKEILRTPLTDKQKIAIQDEFQQFIKMGMINFFHASLESSFRTFVTIADPNFTKTDDSFKKSL